MLSSALYPNVVSLRQKGFSLIELMVGLGVLMLLLFIAVPGFSNFTLNSSADSLQQNFQSSLLMARSEAIKRNQVVKLCAKQASADQCQIPATADWKNGWLVFIDGSDDADRLISSSAEMLKVVSAISGQTSFVRTTASGVPARGTLCFNGYGLLCSDKDAGSEFVIDTPSEPNVQHVRKVAVTIVGKVLLSSDKFK